MFGQAGAHPQHREFPQRRQGGRGQHRAGAAPPEVLLKIAGRQHRTRSQADIPRLRVLVETEPARPGRLARLVLAAVAFPQRAVGHGAVEQVARQRKPGFGWIACRASRVLFLLKLAAQMLADALKAAFKHA